MEKLTRVLDKLNSGFVLSVVVVLLLIGIGSPIFQTLTSEDCAVPVTPDVTDTPLALAPDSEGDELVIRGGAGRGARTARAEVELDQPTSGSSIPTGVVDSSSTLLGVADDKARRIDPNQIVTTAEIRSNGRLLVTACVKAGAISLRSGGVYTGTVVVGPQSGIEIPLTVSYQASWVALGFVMAPLFGLIAVAALQDIENTSRRHLNILWSLATVGAIAAFAAAQSAALGAYGWQAAVTYAAAGLGGATGFLAAARGFFAGGAPE